MEEKHLEQAMSGERRIVTILFCDVKGSTSMAEKLDPEVWASIMNRAYEHLIAPVTRHGGTVAELLGDAILAYFGAPLSHEDDPQRAVLAGLEILAGISTFRQQLQNESGLDFNVRVGINTGLVMAGQIGSGQRVTYTAVGDAVNLAARMEQTAQPGTMQITAETHKLVAPLFECESLGQIEVKGKSEPIQTYRVLGLNQKPGPVRGLAAQGLRSPLVGREGELATLTQCIDRLLHGQGGIVSIVGEAGLGKSRLVAEAKSVAFSNSTNVLWLEAQTLSFGQSISYWPFQEILRHWASIGEDDDADSSWSKLESCVRELFGEETIDYLPYLVSLLALEVKGAYAERVKYLDGEAMGKQIFLTSRRVFERLARTRPTVFVFEDLHWMDESSTLLLEHLLPLVETVPLVILGVSRPERETPAARLREVCLAEFADRYTEIRLRPLSGLDSVQLIDNLLDIENIPARLRELIVDKADGNPFFLEEVIRTLVDSGAVARDSLSGRWRATEQIEAIHIPNTIQGVIMARIDRLDAELKDVLRVASVIGRSFLFRVLKAIAQVGQRLDNDLTELQASELIHEKQHLPELEYMFKHALAQEATYESILLSKRRGLHAHVAQAVESLFADRLEEFYGLLAYHYAQAEDWDHALDYLLKAADQAGQMAADAEALYLYEQAIAAYGKALGGKWDQAQRASVERKMGEAFWRRGDHQKAIEHFRRALSYLGYSLPMSPGDVRLALARELVVQTGHRLWPRKFVRPAVPLTPRPVEDEGWIYVRMAWIDAYSNPERFLGITLRVLNFAEKTGFSLGVALGCSGLGIALDFLGLFRLARWYHRYGLSVAKELQLPYALGTAYIGLQTHELYSGESALGLEHGRQSYQASYQTGDVLTLAVRAQLLAWALAHLGDLAEAAAQSQELITLGKDAEARQAWCWGETTLGYALRRQGKLAEAILHDQKAIERAEIIPDHTCRINAGAELGLCYLHQGNPDRALSELETCLRIWTEQRMNNPYADVTILNNLAEFHSCMAEQGPELQRNTSLNKARSLGRAALRAGSRCRPKLPKAVRLRGTYEWLCGKPAAAQKWWNKSLAEAERMGLKYDIAMIHLEMGQRLSKPAHLEQAEAIFAAIGADVDLAKARELIQGLSG